MLRKSQPLKWLPIGISDTLDATNTFSGAMAALTNLIQDQSTRGLWVCRPASIELADFTGFATPAFVSAMLVVGTRVYGMVASTRNAGKDEPFCYDVLTDAFVAISGVTNANTPLSPAAVGAWTPPTMALIGTFIIVTHPGFAGSANFFGWIDVSVPATPAWNAGNTATNALAAIPVSVAQYGGRAWYAVNTATIAAVVCSDVLVPLTVTNATQVVTLNDNIAVTALGQLGLNNAIAGGIVQSLVVFKGVSTIIQILGDVALGTLTKNSLAVPTGTFAQNSVCRTPKGLAFASPEGLRFIDTLGNVSDPVGVDGAGIAIPFQYAVQPTRIAAACNGNVLRVSLQNGNIVGTPNQEYWYDLSRKSWSGPHTFAASLLQPLSNTFVKTALGVTAKLFQSDPIQSLTSTYVENGTQLTFNYQTAVLPDTDTMNELAMIETTIDIAYPAAVPSFFAYVANQDGSIYDSVLLAPGGTATIWGAFQWGQAVWRGDIDALVARPLEWSSEIVFRRMYIGISGTCAADFKIGTLRMRYRMLGYLQQTAGG